MNLKNDYKVLYEVIEGDNRVFKASKTGSLLDADVIDTIAKGTYKLIYQDVDHKIRGSVSGIPAETDSILPLNNIFFEAEEVEPEEAVVTPENEQSIPSEPEVVNPTEDEEEITEE